MANVEKLVRDALVSVSSVTDLVGQRVFFNQAPQGTSLPYAVIQLVTEDRRAVLNGPDVIPQALVQIDVIASNVGSMGDVRAAIRTALDTYNTTPIRYARLQDQRNAYDENTEYPRAIMEFEVRYTD